MSLRQYILADLKANAGDPKIQVLLVFFRLTQAAINQTGPMKAISIPSQVIYRLFSEWILGIELRPRTNVGAGLTVYHGYGLVVNTDTVIGERCVLRNGVTIGHRFPGGPCPRIGDDVQIGAHATIIGGIHLANGCKVGAGSVVVNDVPEGATVVGVPARRV